MGEASQPRPVRKVMGCPTTSGTLSHAKNSFGLRKVGDVLPGQQSQSSGSLPCRSSVPHETFEGGKNKGANDREGSLAVYLT